LRGALRTGDSALAVQGVMAAWKREVKPLNISDCLEEGVFSEARIRHGPGPTLCVILAHRTEAMGFSSAFLLDSVL
jgi:hypothetical protein